MNNLIDASKSFTIPVSMEFPAIEEEFLKSFGDFVGVEFRKPKKGEVFIYMIGLNTDRIVPQWRICTGDHKYLTAFVAIFQPTQSPL